MELISIIPDFHPLNDENLLRKADQIKPEISFADHLLPKSCQINGKSIAPEALASLPLRRGDQAVLDFGNHMVGRLTLLLDATGSHQDAPAHLQIDLAEIRAELEESPQDYQGWLSSSWIQQERLHLDTLPARVELPRRYAFRYVRVTVLDTSPKFQLLLCGAQCRAESAADWKNVPPREIGDEELKKIYDVSLKTLADCTQQIMEDGPKRDRRLWLGDLRLQALVSYGSFRSLKVIKRCLYLFAGTRFPDGRMSANVFTDPSPAADDTYLMDYALMYPIVLEEYLQETNDAEALNDLFEPALEQTDYVLRHCLDEKGLIARDAAKESFIDWSDTLNRRAAVQGVLICALDAAAALCGRKGAESRRQECLDMAQRLRKAAKDHFWQKEEGCFSDGGQIAIHTQVWLTLAGIMPQEAARAAFEKALRLPDAPRMKTPYMHHYYIMALLRSGLRDEAEAHLRAYWGGMIRAGADTFWECYDPDDPAGSPYGGRIVNSFCHAWSCTPAYLISRYFI